MSDSATPSPVSAIGAARLLAALEATKNSATRANEEQRAVGVELAGQRRALEAAQESAQKLALRSRDIRNSLHVLRESVDRAKLSALNAGLEGARLGEPLGKALVVMSDEQRNLLARALDALDEHGALLAEVERERERCLAELSQLGEGARRTGAALARAEQQSQLTNALLHELRTDFVERFAGAPELTQAMADATARVQTAADALRELTQHTPLGKTALRELLSPLLSLLPNGEDPPR